MLLTDREVIGESSFGSSYTAFLRGSIVVVKKLDDVDATKHDFAQHLDHVVKTVAGNRHVATLRGYDYSTDEKLLLYDYYPAGSLMALLHGNTGGHGRTLFAWEPRLQVALGIVKGIADIHSTGGSHFTLGNIKASNILLVTDQDMEARITDIGLFPIMDISLIKSSHSSGYQAPEVLETKEHTYESDIYSYGVLLLELLTGKEPSGEDLPGWVKKVLREEWTDEVYDVQLKKSSKADEMLKMLTIALACVNEVPNNRPSISEVVEGTIPSVSDENQ